MKSLVYNPIKPHLGACLSKDPDKHSLYSLLPLPCFHSVDKGQGTVKLV